MILFSIKAKTKWKPNNPFSLYCKTLMHYRSSPRTNLGVLRAKSSLSPISFSRSVQDCTDKDVITLFSPLLYLLEIFYYSNILNNFGVGSSGCVRLCLVSMRYNGNMYYTISMMYWNSKHKFNKLYYKGLLEVMFGLLFLPIHLMGHTNDGWFGYG